MKLDGSERGRRGEGGGRFGLHHGIVHPHVQVSALYSSMSVWSKNALGSHRDPELDLGEHPETLVGGVGLEPSPAVGGRRADRCRDVARPGDLFPRSARRRGFSTSFTCFSHRLLRTHDAVRLRVVEWPIGRTWMRAVTPSQSYETPPPATACRRPAQSTIGSCAEEREGRNSAVSVPGRAVWLRFGTRIS